MINDYGHLKHKCIIIPFSYFRESMNDLYDMTEEPDNDLDSMNLMWSFDDSNHFRFKHNTKWIRERCNLPLITMDDIQEFFYVDNIVDIVADSRNADNANVYIIYD